MLIYHDWNRSPNCLKTKILLLELGVPFEQRNVDRAIMQTDAYRAKFPTGAAPAMEDGEIRIAESAAIALHLAEKHGALIPTEAPQRALMFQALSIEASLVAPTLGGQGYFGELGKPEAERNPQRLAELRTKAQRVAQILGGALGDRTYFAGDFSIADIQLYAATSKALEAGVFADPPRNLVDWCARMTARPSVAQAREQYVNYQSKASAPRKGE